ncbi:MAG: hypothetical protein ACO24H_08015 [Polynucleobacter sp.]
MTISYSTPPLEHPCYWESENASCIADFRDAVADQLARNHGWNGNADDLEGNYYLEREYYFGASAEETAEIIWEFDITWED